MATLVIKEEPSSPAPEAKIHPFLESKFSWDASKLGPYCSLAEDRTTLLNYDAANQSRWRFSGSSGTLTLTERDQAYWEVHICLYDLGRQTSFDSWHCELGVTSEADLKGADVQTPVCAVNKSSTTMQVHFLPRETASGSSQQEDEPSLSSSEKAVFESCATFGFFFDGPGAQLFLVTDMVRSYDVDLSRGPVVFFVNVADREKCGKEIRVQLKSGSDVTVTADNLELVSLLVLKEEVTDEASSIQFWKI